VDGEAGAGVVTTGAETGGSGELAAGTDRRGAHHRPIAFEQKYKRREPRERRRHEGRRINGLML